MHFSLFDGFIDTKGTGTTMHNKDKVILDKKLKYEYNIRLYILEELCDEGAINIFEMSDAIILLRKKYKMPVLNIYGKKRRILATNKLGKE